MSIRFRAELEKLVKAQIEHETQSLALGNIQNMRDYARRAGKLSGLRLVADLCDEAEKKINEDR